MLHACNPNTYVEGNSHRSEASKLQDAKSTQPDPDSRRGSKSRVLAWHVQSRGTDPWHCMNGVRKLKTHLEHEAVSKNKTRKSERKELQGQGNSLVSRGPAWHAQRSGGSIWHSINPDMVVCTRSSNTEEVEAGGSEVEWVKVILSFKMSFSPA